MTGYEVLRRLHALARPRNYLEIGVNQGRSLALSRVPSIGVDPSFEITRELRCDLHLVKATSDDFFARADPINHLRSGRNPLRNLRRGRPPFGHYFGKTSVDLAYIDGMHQVEFALRDFMNIERLAHWASVIVFDDVLPRNVDEAARDRHTIDWAGDIYKIIDVLRTYRPDLTAVALDTHPTGVLVVLGADSSNRVLADNYDRIVEEIVVPDPQTVPASILARHDAVAPEAFLGARFWPDLVRARNRHAGRSSTYERVRAEMASLAPLRTDSSPLPRQASPVPPGR
ncbi:MAG: class I SAM-dependent methyltransferase [Chloroflexota bacterium]|nr:class I SAM-dependent methyltransferase [Chloroflexota bacterium]